jgi:hypothetical protein
MRAGLRLTSALLLLLGACAGEVRSGHPVPPPPDAGPPMPDAALDPDLATPAPDASPDVSLPPDLAPDLPPDAPPPLVHARDLQISRVEISQSVFVRLDDAGAVVPLAKRNAPIIEGRPLFVRVHVATASGFSARRLRGRLILTATDGSTRELDDQRDISASTKPDLLDGSFNFLVPAEGVTPGLGLRADVFELGEGAEPDQPPRFPASGDPADLDVKAGKMELDVVLIPALSVGGPLMDTPERRQHLERYLYDVYPVQKLNARWREPLTFTKKITYPEGFKALQDARVKDGARPEEYYHLLIAVEDTLETFLGISQFAGDTPGDAARRIAITFVTKRSIDSEMDTVSHEMGHNHGRLHVAGCNAQGVDPDYPYPNTGVGVSGYSFAETAYKPAATYKDLMGYCYPTWISDYTYRGFEKRVRTVTAFAGAGPTTSAFAARSLQGFQGAGAPLWGIVDGALVSPSTAVTPSRHAVVTLTTGRRLTAPVGVSPFSEAPGRELTVPLPPTGDIARVDVTVDGQRWSFP